MQKLTRLIKSYKSLFVWLLVALVLGLLINNRHHKTGSFNWMTPLWADQAGYYVYLPGLFVYQFDPATFPENIAGKMGDGFSIDLENKKVITRYTCGVAILQAPFFLFIHVLAGIKDQPQDGFSGIYHQVPNFAALFYCVVGLFFLWKFLLFYYDRKIVIFTLLALFFGTNLYYYAVDSTGMSHIYSFALFAIAAWLTKKFLSADSKHNLLYFINWSFIFALIVLIRPTNILLFPFLVCLDCKAATDFRLRLKTFVTLRNILVLAGAFLIVFLPQFLYWKHTYGSFIADSYAGYGFSNWKSPKILELFFSPNNGLFLYSPFYIVVLWGLFLMVRQNISNGWPIALTFIVITYVFASWFIFSFGCGFGSRNYVEYLVLFSLPVGFLFSQLSKLPKSRKKIAVVAVIAALVIFNVRLVYSYNRCFQGGDWDFQEYFAFIIKIKKYRQSLPMEAKEHMGPENEYSTTLYVPTNKIYYLKFKKAVVRSKVMLKEENSEALLVLSVQNPDSVVYWNAFRLRDQINKLHKKQAVEGEFWLPVPLPENSTIATYIWNKEKESLSFNQLKIFLE